MNIHKKAAISSQNKPRRIIQALSIRLCQPGEDYSTSLHIETTSPVVFSGWNPAACYRKTGSPHAYRKHDLRIPEKNVRRLASKANFTPSVM